MRQNIKQFRGTLEGLGEVEVNHDQQKIEDMEAKMFELQQNHERIMSWADMNRHKSAAWKDAINANLKKLGREIVAEDTTLQGERLDSEMSLTNGLRNVWGNLQSEIGETDAEDARTYEHTANSFGKGIADLTRHSELNEEDLQKAYEAGTEALRKKEKAGEDVRKGIAFGRKLLDNTLVNLNVETKVAQGQVANMKLPLLVSSDANVAITKKYNEVQSTLNEHLARASSLLQEKDLKPSSLLQENSKVHLRNPKTRKEEISAIKKLNDMLYQQGSKLAQQNSFLEKGLSYVKGLPLPQTRPQ